MSKERQQEIEGCLSIPGMSGVTDRPMSVTVEAMNRDGETVQLTGSGLTARCFCHELDHLDGVLYTDKALEVFSNEEAVKRKKARKKN